MLGKPAAGKGTQAQMLSSKLGIPQISTGDIFRQMAESGDSLGVEARDKYWGKGNLVPDDVTNKLVHRRLQQPDCKNGYILDGYPRTIGQAQFLDTIASIDAVIEIDVPDEKLLERIRARRICPKCKIAYNLVTEPKPKNDEICDVCKLKLVKRQDEEESVVKNRLVVYAKETKPLKEYYNKQGKLHVFDGDQGIKSLYKQIVAFVK